MKKLSRLLTFVIVSLLGTLCMQAQYSFTTSNVEANKGETVALAISMNNGDVSVTSFQFDLYLPEGVTVQTDEGGNPVSQLSSRKSDHVVATSRLNDGAYRFLAYSSQNSVFSGTDGKILTTNILLNGEPGEYDITIKNGYITQVGTFDEFACTESTSKLKLVVPVESISFEQSSYSLKVEEAQTLKVNFLPEDASDKTLTWASSAPGVATVSEAGLVTGVTVVTATITATSHNGKTAQCQVTVNPILAESVTLNKTSLELLLGGTETLVATVKPDNTTDKTVTWTSSNTSVATVDNSGNVTTVAVGNATISATCGSVSATCAVTVNPVPAESVTLNKTSVTLKAGATEALTATVMPENTTDKTVTWTSSDESVATVDKTGKITAVKKGSATITAACGTVSATCAVTVEYSDATDIIVTPGSGLDDIFTNGLTLKDGESKKIDLTVVPATASPELVWTSNNESAVTVDKDGNVTAASVGTATVTVTCGSFSKSFTVTVNPILAESVVLNKTSLELFMGETETLTATVKPDNTTDPTVTWTSSNEAVATVDSEGKVTTVGVGTATITATCGSASATCTVTGNPVLAESVTLNKTSITLKAGDTETLTATVKPDNTTYPTVTWTSSNEVVATVDNTGKITAIAVGEATITAACGNVSATCVVTVNPVLPESVTLNKTSVTLKVGATETLVATILPENTTDKTVTWKSYNESIVTVDENGKLTAVAVGSTTITATCGSVYATCSVTVNPVEAEMVILNNSTLSMKVGESQTLVATVLPDNTTYPTVKWTSSNEAVATVDGEGKVTGVGVGEATITAACGNVSATCVVTVDPVLPESVELNKTSLELMVGDSETLTATVLPDNTTYKTVVWSTDDEDIAMVDQNGCVTGMGVGSVLIRATCGDIVGLCEVTVNPVPAESVSLNKTSLELKVGEFETLEAIVLPEETTYKTVTWTSSDENVALVNEFGRVMAVSVGSTTITATCGDAWATCDVTIIDESGIEALFVDEDGREVEVYDLHGVRITTKNVVPGVYIRRVGGTVEKVLIK